MAVGENLHNFLFAFCLDSGVKVGDEIGLGNTSPGDIFDFLYQSLYSKAPSGILRQRLQDEFGKRNLSFLWLYDSQKDKKGDSY